MELELPLDSLQLVEDPSPAKDSEWLEDSLLALVSHCSLCLLLAVSHGALAVMSVTQSSGMSLRDSKRTGPGRAIFDLLIVPGQYSSLNAIVELLCSDCMSPQNPMVCVECWPACLNLLLPATWSFISGLLYLLNGKGFLLAIPTDHKRIMLLTPGLNTTQR